LSCCSRHRKLRHTASFAQFVADIELACENPIHIRKTMWLEHIRNYKGSSSRMIPVNRGCSNTQPSETPPDAVYPLGRVPDLICWGDLI
jgi:hypothetical protein